MSHLNTIDICHASSSGHPIRLAAIEEESPPKVAPRRISAWALPLVASFLLHWTNVAYGAECWDTRTSHYCDAGPDDPEGTEMALTLTCTSGNNWEITRSQVGTCIPEDTGPERMESIGNCDCWDPSWD